jgi:hypothetical protein
MGPGANERSNGFFVRWRFRAIAFAAAPFPVSAGTATIAVSRTTAFAARWAISTPLARALAIAWRRTVWTTAIKSWWWAWWVRRMRQTLLDEFGHLVEFGMA